MTGWAAVSTAMAALALVLLAPPRGCVGLDFRGAQATAIPTATQAYLGGMPVIAVFPFNTSPTIEGEYNGTAKRERDKHKVGWDLGCFGWFLS